MVIKELTISNRRGLHARASAKFVALAGQFDARVTIGKGGGKGNEENSEVVAATSLMGLMMLAVGFGSSVVLRAEGQEAQAALDALAALIEDKFGEE